MPTVSGVTVNHLIDDRVDFIPRISNKPETAPAFDHLRVVVSMPVVTGAACINDQCKCFTAQGSDAGLSSSECLTWAKSPPFNPYLLAEKLGVDSQNPVNSSPVHGATTKTSGVSSPAPV
jgi:zona occludens toxin